MSGATWWPLPGAGGGGGGGAAGLGDGGGPGAVEPDRGGGRFGGGRRRAGGGLPAAPRRYAHRARTRPRARTGGRRLRRGTRQRPFRLGARHRARPRRRRRYGSPGHHRHLAGALAEAGQYERARTLYTGVLADMARVLGSEHRDTPSSRTQVAMALILPMRPAEGITQLERTLADCERVLGADAPQTVRLRQDLARTFETVSGVLCRSGERSSPRPGPSRGTFR
ncbi:tetratricopeptide repeat protein [Streptomyces sp. NPDC001770]